MPRADSLLLFQWIRNNAVLVEIVLREEKRVRPLFGDSGKMGGGHAEKAITDIGQLTRIDALKYLVKERFIDFIPIRMDQNRIKT